MIAMVCLAAVALAPRQARAADEYEIKAAFVINFLQFVQWPAGSFNSAKAPIVVATLGGDPFHGMLESNCVGEVVGGRTVVVKHFAHASDFQPCQVLFVASGYESDLATVLQHAGPGLLTIGETADFIRQGGIIGFYTDNNHVRFEISSTATTRAKLQISAKLLRLSKPRP